MDDGFRKPYEYFEEKRGILLIFIVMLLSVDVFLSLNSTAVLYNSFRYIPVLATGLLVIGILFFLFLLFTAFSCFKLKKNMVTIAKIYLIVRTVFMISSIVIIFIHDWKSMIGQNPWQYKTAGECVSTELLFPLAYDLAFGVVWYIYFIKSKRWREFVKKSIME